jgi:hypothetical protein
MLSAGRASRARGLGGVVRGTRALLVAARTAALAVATRGAAAGGA